MIVSDWIFWEQSHTVPASISLFFFIRTNVAICTPFNFVFLNCVSDRYRMWSAKTHKTFGIEETGYEIKKSLLAHRFLSIKILDIHGINNYLNCSSSAPVITINLWRKKYMILLDWRFREQSRVDSSKKYRSLRIGGALSKTENI